MKTLKLVGLERYISPLTKYTLIVTDDVIVVDDAVAEHMLDGQEDGPAGVKQHWEVLADGTRATHDFSTGNDTASAKAHAVAEPAPAPVVIVVQAEGTATGAPEGDAKEEAKEEAPAAKAAPVVKSQRVARKPAAKK
jgi:hypothetical protein